MNKNLLIKEIISSFDFNGEFICENSHYVGNINDTFIVSFKDGESIKKYIIQRINHKVFTRPDKLMDNMSKITLHISDKVKLSGGDILRESLNLVKTKEGKHYYKTDSGEYWRAFLFIEDASTYMKVEKPDHIYEVGKALGKFQNQLSDFNAEDLYEVIKDFHNTPKRYMDFQEAIEKDIAGRVSTALVEIKYIMDRADELSILVDLQYDGKLPLRVTHNDTKINNIMIDDNTGKAICVIDLDTVMPGLSLYDFGDAIRSGCSTAAEDEVDLDKVNLDIELYENFVKGLLEESKKTLNKYEIENIAFSAKLITIELAMRFLTDYLNGDTYFKVTSENHNLDRTRNQLKLASDIENNFDMMNEIVNKYI